jgi:hypothetical protein
MTVNIQPKLEPLEDEEIPGGEHLGKIEKVILIICIMEICVPCQENRKKLANFHVVKAKKSDALVRRL